MPLSNSRRFMRRIVYHSRGAERRRRAQAVVNSSELVINFQDMRLKRWWIAVALTTAWAGGCKKERPPPPPPSVPAETPKPPDPSVKPPAPAQPGQGAAKPTDVPGEDPEQSPFAWLIHSGDGKSKLKQK